ncbi:hypothetical protein [Wenxinia marina]|uniref:Uncharacterized protein n=1 Tax=Wenxinia marina DSM 24838 TaxID=1123501 RepID=A0A0D0QKA4_9RHOB|nr:hypothetical protein [Wenxinia marina]KIQ71438.1 hypothetical protein Wenmar_04086 [Wenxinia marina DSM 24838]GGL78994.1 hypothetical protein GCM10011392_36880 [Wenxinia marina]
MSQTDLTPAPEGEIATAGSRIPMTLSVLALFARAKFVRPAPILHHLPLLFWITEVLRPAATLSLGGTDALAHFAICQTVERLDTGAECWAVAGGTDGFDGAILDYNDQQYAEFSTLLPGPVAEAIDGIEAESFDLLVIEAAMLAEAVSAGMLRRLSRGGIVVIHGLRSAAALPAVLGERDTLVFPHGDGAVVVGDAQELPSRLATLLDFGTSHRDTRMVRQIFRRLGGGQHAEGEAERARSEVDEAHGLVRRARDREVETAHRLKAEQQQTESLRAEMQARDERAAAAALGLEAAQEEIRSAQAEAEVAGNQVRTLRGDLDAARRRLEEVEAERDAAQSRADALETGHGTAGEATGLEAERERADGLAAQLREMGKLLEEAEARAAPAPIAGPIAAADSEEHEALRRLCAELGDRVEAETGKVRTLEAERIRAAEEIAALTARIDTVSAQLEKVRRERDKLAGRLKEETRRSSEAARAVEDLLSSTSWKVTSPLRAVSRTFRS